MMMNKDPTYIQSLSTTILLLGLLAATFPFTLVFSLAYSLIHRRTPSTPNANPKTVLITGARRVKSLSLARAFHSAGHRVILADEVKWGWLTASRFSNTVSTYYDLPNADVSGRYERTIGVIVEKEKVDLWVPASSAASTVQDAIAAQKVGAGGRIRCFITSPHVTEILDQKDAFMALCKELGFEIPASKSVSSVEEAVNFLHSTEVTQKYILKCTSINDLGRSDLTPMPFTTREETTAHLSRIPLPISKRDPYVLQEFMVGDEYCTHAHAVNGVLRSLIVCPSNDMLMRYEDCGDSEIGKQLEEWVVAFMARLKKKMGELEDLTGHFSFDFMLDANGRILPIECNPRAHTAIVLLDPLPQGMLANSYMADSNTNLPILRPLPNTKPVSWVFHAFPLACASYLPTVLHPLLDELSPTSPAQVLLSYLQGDEVDSIFDGDDVWAFVAQYLQWSWLLSRQLFVWRNGWKRLNVSTSKIFGC